MLPHEVVIALRDEFVLQNTFTGSNRSRWRRALVRRSPWVISNRSTREETTDDNLAVHLQRDALHRVVHVWIEVRVQTAIAIQTSDAVASRCADRGEVAGEQNLPIG